MLREDRNRAPWEKRVLTAFGYFENTYTARRFEMEM
jgi:hypothetical protein